MEINPRDSKGREAKQAMEAHGHALSMVLKEFPEFPKLMRKLERIIGGYIKDRGIAPTSMQFSEAKWHNDGMVTFEVLALNLVVPNGSTWGEVMHVVWGIAHQLVAYAAAAKTTTRLVEFKRVQIDSRGRVTFRVYYANRPMAPRDVHLTGKVRAT